MPVVLRLKRFGRLNHPTFRLCAADSRYPRDGRVIETLGYYLPKMQKLDAQLSLNAERIGYWLGVGAQPSPTAVTLLKRVGIKLPARKKRVRTKSKAKPKPFVPPKKKTPKPKKAKAEGDKPAGT